MSEQGNSYQSARRSQTSSALRLSVLLPVAITLAIWVAGAIILVIFPQQFNLVLGLIIGFSLLLYLVYWSRHARPSARLAALIFAVPAFVGIAWGTIEGDAGTTLIGVGITFVLLLLQRVWHTPLSYRAARRQFAQGNIDAALDLIHRSIVARPDFWQSYQLRALIHLMNLNLQHAEKDARRAIAISPKAHPVYNTLGQILLAQNRFAEAGGVFATALSYAPDYALYHYHMGLSHYRQELYGEAAQSFAQATQTTLATAAYDLQAYYYLGRSLEQFGEPALMEQAYANMIQFAGALPVLQRQVNDLPAYPHTALLQADAEDIRDLIQQRTI